MKSVLMQEKQMICEEIWNLARSALIHKYPFFRPLFLHYVFQMDETVEGAGTDGKVIYYQPDFLMELYRKSMESVEHLFLHMMYHCLFLHIIMEEKEEKRYWHCACDIAAERMAEGKWSEEIRAECIYEELKQISCSEVIKADDHRCWTRGSQEELLEVVDKQWNHLERHTQGAGIGGVSDGRGNQAGSKTEQIHIRKKGTCDFRSYLRKFAVTGEEMETDTESFDYIPYLYGLEHYGNMPLVEHLEYKEVKKLEELVIAIDTSGSCSAEIVRRFMEETYGILSNHENFFRKMNVYIIQCDFQVQHVEHIASEDEWKRYMENLVIHGRSGTDFRPVFHYVKDLMEREELKNLRGLVYFTDGDGIYPEAEPEYETAFVFYKEKSQHQQVPKWAMQMTLEEEDEY